MYYMGLLDTVQQATDEEMIRYYNVEQQAQAYAWNFWQNTLCAMCLMQEGTNHPFKDTILPLFFFDADLDKQYNKANPHDKIRRIGQFTYYGSKQAHIEIPIKRSQKTLSKKLKQTIRHELCHYALWLAGLPCEDASIEFWVLAAIMEAQPYMVPDKESQEYIQTVLQIYNEKVKDMPESSIKYILIGKMVSQIHNSTANTYETEILPTINYLAAMADRMYGKDNLES